jgi:hypothetical protein
VVAHTGQPLDGIHGLEVSPQEGIQLRAVEHGLLAIQVHELLEGKGIPDNVGSSVLETPPVLGSDPLAHVCGEAGVPPGDELSHQRGRERARIPNLFLVLGPYSATRSSWFTMAEAQTTHAARCLSKARRRRAKTIEVRQEPHDAFFRDVLRRQKNSVLFKQRLLGRP